MKILLTSLITLSFFITACSNKNNLRDIDYDLEFKKGKTALSKKKFIKANQPIMMGDICCTKNKQSQVSYEVLSSDQIEKIQLLNFDKIIYEKN